MLIRAAGLVVFEVDIKHHRALFVHAMFENKRAFFDGGRVSDFTLWSDDRFGHDPRTIVFLCFALNGQGIVCPPIAIEAA